jgi:hypothetical protein
MLRHEELPHLYGSPRAVRVMKSRRFPWTEYVIWKGQRINASRVENPVGNRPVWRPKSKSEDNIKMDLREIGGEMGGGWNWLRVMLNGGLGNYRCSIFGVHYQVLSTLNILFFHVRCRRPDWLCTDRFGSLRTTIWIPAIFIFYILSGFRPITIYNIRTLTCLWNSLECDKFEADVSPIP